MRIKQFIETYQSNDAPRMIGFSATTSKNEEECVIGSSLTFYSDEDDERLGHTNDYAVNINTFGNDNMMSLILGHEFGHWINFHLKGGDFNEEEEEEQIAHMTSYLLNDNDERLNIFLVDTPKVTEEAKRRLYILESLDINVLYDSKTKY